MMLIYFCCLILVVNFLNAQSSGKFVRIPDNPDPNPSQKLRNVLDEASVIEGSGNDPLKSCSVTSQFELDTSNSNWLLRSLDLKGNMKNVGGDELYITFHSYRNRVHPTAVALVKDRLDGSYALRFKSTPMKPELFRKTKLDDKNQGGILTIHYLYTCGISELTPQEKRNWKHGGFVNTEYELHMDKVPIIHEFQPPTLPEAVKPFDYVLGIGDSMMMHFAGFCTVADYSRSNGNYTDRFSSPLNSLTAEYYLEKVKKDIQQEKSRNEIFQKNSSASLLVILGSGVWDLAEKNIIRSHLPAFRGTHYFLDKKFSDHSRGVNMVLNAIVEEYSSEPNIQFAWKSNTATHPHKMPTSNPKALNHTKCITLSRSKRLYIIQKSLTARYDVPFLDIYEASYLSADYHTDTSHFQPVFDEVTWNWFFPQNRL